MAVPIRFPPFRLDPDAGRLYRGDEPVALRPKAYLVLRHLAERPGRLVTKDELLEGAWGETHVSEGVLKVCIRELRQALGDTAREPTFIETVHRRGYRFVAAIEVGGPPAPVRATPLEATLVGRDDDLAVLRDRLRRACAGTRQIVFVTGVPGIGKTTLLDAVASDVASSDSPVWVARGQCVAHYGAGEAFLPVLDALGRLGRGDGGAQVVALLREHAPSWLLQLPGLAGPGERAALSRAYAGSGRERMLRELVGGLDAICAVQPLVLLLEDLHWSDDATIELLAAVARGRSGARVLVVGSLRPADAMASHSALAAVVRELCTRRLATELPLAPLDEEAVGEYLKRRFGAGEVADRLRGPLHRRTEGNPLFLVNVTDHLVRSGSVARVGARWCVELDPSELERGTPESLAALLESQLDRLDPIERRTLAVASSMGQEFASPAVAAALGEEPAAVEACCTALARRGEFLRPLSERRWPDGTVAARYAFGHALYREALERELGPAERRQIHRRLGERLEAGFAGDEGEVATQLALHFERGGDTRRAVRYLHRAGDRATSRHAYGAAVEHLSRALDLLTSVADGPEKIETELLLRVSLGAPLLNSRGFGAPEVQETYARALELCARVGETPQLFPVLMGLQAYYASAGELPRAHGLSRQVLRLSERLRDRVMRLEANHALGCDLFKMAELERSAACHRAAIAAMRPEEGAEAYRSTGHDPKTCCLGNLAITTHYLGRPDHALRLAGDALAWAERIRLPFSLVQAHTNCAWVHLLRYEPDLARESCARALALSDEYDLLYWKAITVLLDAWALAQRLELTAARERVEEGGAIARLMGPHVCETEYRVLRAGIEVVRSPSRDLLVDLDDVLVLLDASSEQIHRSELERQRGELLAMLAGEGDAALRDEARMWLERSLATARAQASPHLELRAASALVRHRPTIGEAPGALHALAEVYARYDEGLDTFDLVAARRLLE